VLVVQKWVFGDGMHNSSLGFKVYQQFEGCNSSSHHTAVLAVVARGAVKFVPA
jgi:hypothetical protein